MMKYMQDHFQNRNIENNFKALTSGNLDFKNC